MLSLIHIYKNDYDTKLRALTRFLADGNKAKVTLRYRGREMAHQEFGTDLLNKEMCIRDRSKPRRKLTGIVFKQHADEAFQAADDCAVEHHRSGSAVAFGHIFGTEASRHLEVDLDRTALPPAA